MDALYISQILGSGLELLFFVLIIVFAVQALFLVYHWFAYGDSLSVSMTALAVYLAGGAFLFLTFSIAINTVLL